MTMNQQVSLFSPSYPCLIDAPAQGESVRISGIKLISQNQNDWATLWWHFSVTCLRDLFETVDNRTVIDFIKEIRFYSLL